MNDDKHQRREHSPVGVKKPGKDSRQDRLKLALRENLKRRKSQARGRSDVAIEPSGGDGPSPHDGRENPGK